jgi:hypothetical protein
MTKINEIKRRGDQELDLVERVVNDKSSKLYNYFLITSTIRDGLLILHEVCAELSQVDIEKEPETFMDKLVDSFEYLLMVEQFSSSLGDNRLDRALKKTKKRMIDMYKFGFRSTRYDKYIFEVEKLVRMTQLFKDLSADVKVSLLNGER